MQFYKRKQQYFLQKAATCDNAAKEKPKLMTNFGAHLIGSGEWTLLPLFHNRLVLRILHLLKNLQLKKLLHIVGTLRSTFRRCRRHNIAPVSGFFKTS